MTDPRPGTTAPGTTSTGGRAGHGEPVNEMDVDHSSSSPVGPLVTGAVMLVAGLVMLQQTLAIKGEGLAPEGPRFLPFAVVSLWILLSVLYLGQQLVRMVRRAGTLPAERFTHLLGAAALLVLLVVYAYVLDYLGYMVATTLFFLGAARAMGSRQVVRDLVVSLAVAVLVYFVFTRALGVHLPEGVLGI